MRYAPWLVLAVLLVFVGKAWGERGGGTEFVTRVDSVPDAAYRQMVANLYLSNEGWRAQLEGIEALPPEVIVRTDTVVAPPDTVYRFVTVDGAGRLAVELLTRRDSAVYAPELHAGFIITDCDEGWQIRGSTVLCNRARLGHAYLTADAGRYDALAGLDWQPSFRSPWLVSFGRAFPYDRSGDRWEFRVKRRVRLW